MNKNYLLFYQKDYRKGRIIHQVMSCCYAFTFLFLFFYSNSISAQELWAWGLNSYGQLGDGTTTNALIPKKIGGSDNWKEVACGSYHTVALKSDGTLWAWGRNNNGQLGDGTTIDKASPVQIGTDSWSHIATNAQHAIAIKADGTLWAWGDNIFGQLGNGSTTNSTVPVLVSAATNWSQIAAGDNFSLFLKNNGTLWACGENIFGELGDGGSHYQKCTNLIQIGSDDNWIQVACGNYHILALKSDGTLWAWGYGQNGELGNGKSGTNVSLWIPTQIGTSSDWAKVFAGNYCSFAIKKDGTLWAWGENQFGGLGDGNPLSTFYYGVSSPKQIGTATDWYSISTSMETTFGIKTDNFLWAWGENIYGELGDGNHNTDQLTAEQIGTTNDWKQVSTCGQHTVALKTNATSTGRSIPTISASDIIYNATTKSINISGIHESAQLFLYNLAGKRILCRKIVLNEPILVGSLPEGPYLVKVQTVDGVDTKKIMIQ